MSKHRVFSGLGAAVLGALVLALPAVGATPSEIYKDYADNGALDGAYSQQDLQNALKSASVQGYGSPVIIIKMKQRKTGGLEGEKTPPRGTTIVPPPKNDLPFTGAELGLFTVVGLGLVGSGFLLRLTGRKRSNL
ncbi:MAG: hypothetical protein ABR521_08835 [Gaiellaceae bacterium]